MKTAVAALVLLIAIVVGGLFAAPLIVDANDYRDEIAAEAARLTGHPVAIDGKVAFRVLPSPHFRAEGLRIAGPAELPPVLTARAMDVRFSLAELFGGRIAVDSVLLVEPVLTVATAATGERNIDLARLASLSDVNLAVRRLEIVGGRLEWRDAATGAAYSIGTLKAEIGAESLAGPFELRGEGIVGGEQVAFTGEIGRLDGNARLAIDLDAPALGKGAFRGNLLTGEAPGVAGRLSVETPDLYGALNRLAGRAEADAASAPVAGRLEGRLGYQPQQLVVESLTFKAGSLEGSGRFELVPGATPKLGLRLGFEQVAESELAGHVAALQAYLSAAPPEGGEAGLPVSIDMSLRIDAGVVSFGRGYLRQFTFDADLSRGTLTIRRTSALLPGGSDFTFTGELRTPGGAPRLDGSLEMVSDNLRALLDWAGAPVGAPASDRFRHASLTAAVNANEDVLQVFDIDLRLDQSRLTGGIAVALRRRPSFSADLAADRINADAYLEAFGMQGFGDWPRTGEGSPDLGLLAGFDTNFRARIDRLVLGGEPLDDVSLDFGLLGGRLSLNELAVRQVGGASLRLAGTLDQPARPQLSGALTVAGPDAARFLSSLGAGGREMTERLGAFETEFRFEGGIETLAVELSGGADRLTLAANGSIAEWLAAPRFDMDVSVSSPSLVRLAGLALPSWPLPPRLASEAVFEGHLAGTADAFALKGRLDALAGRLEIDGKHNDGGFEGRLRLRHTDAARLLHRLVGSGAARPADGGAIEADAVLRLRQDSLELADVELTGEAVELVGDMSFRRHALRPEIELRLARARLDADRFLTGPEAEAPRWSRTPLDLLWLNDANALLELKDTTISLRGYRLEAATATARLRDGALQIERLAGGVFGGTARAEASLSGGASPELSLKLALEQVAAEDVLRALADVAPLAGPVDMTLELASAGVTTFDMLRAAEGELSLDGGPLVLKGLDLDALRIGTAGSAWPEGLSELSRLAGDWRIGGGMLRTEAPTRLSLADGEGELRGSIDLERWTLDLEQEMTLATPDGRRTFRLSLAGPIEQPDKRVVEAETN